LSYSHSILKLKFFDTFFGRKKEASSQTKINSKALTEWLDGRMNEKSGSICNKARPLISEIKKNLDEIKTQTENIKNTECPEDIPKRARKIVRTNQPKFVNSMRAILGSADLVEPSNYSELQDFHARLNETLGNLGKSIVSHGRYLPIAFGNEILTIQKACNELARLNGKIAELLGENRDAETVNEIRSRILELNKIAGDIKKLGSEKTRLESDLNNARGDINALDKKIESLERGNAARELNNLKSLIAEHESGLEGLNNLVYEKLAPLKRTLKKIERLVEDEEISGRNLAGVGGYITNPVDAFLTSDSEKFRLMLEDVKVLLLENKLELDDKEKSRTVEKVNTALRELTPKVREERARIAEDIEALKRKVSAFTLDSELNKLAKTKEAMERSILETQKELESNKNKRSKLTNDETELKREITERVNNIWPELTIKWDNQ